MLSSLTIHISASYLLICLALAFVIGAFAGIIATAHFNQTKEDNDIDDPNNWSE